MKKKLAGFKKEIKPKTTHDSLTLKKYNTIFVNPPPETCIRHYLILLSVKNYRLCPDGLLLV